MKVSFSKYSANGNDFILFDNRESKLPVGAASLWRGLCDRRWGIGADGVLFLERPKSLAQDYRMSYLNSDGGEVPMCGNGARTLGHYCLRLKEFEGRDCLSFETLNSIYEIVVDESGEVELMMPEIRDVGLYDLDDFAQELKAKHSLFLDTGVPHCVFWLDDINGTNLMKKAREIRFEKRFPEGVNINFFSRDFVDGPISVRTFERGVDDETQACGTGVVAIARTLHLIDSLEEKWSFSSFGGKLNVRLVGGGQFYLKGEIVKTFEGVVNLSQYQT